MLIACFPVECCPVEFVDDTEVKAVISPHESWQVDGGLGPLRVLKDEESALD